MPKLYDLVAVGDCTVDAFIKLHDASVHCNLRTHRCELCLSFADKIPYEDLTVVPAVGNSSNVAVGAARLGVRSAIVTAVGGDYFGRQILEVYARERVGKGFVKMNSTQPTNYHFVLNYKAERTILIKHNRYDYFDPKKIGDVPWVYFSSMAEHTLPFHRKLARYLAAHPRVRMGFNPGTFQLALGRTKLAEIYRRTHVLFVNREEAQKILGVRNPAIKFLARGLHALGPRIVAITDGPKGSYASDGKSAYFMPPYPDPKPPFERTGAGDAFATGFMAALVYGLPLADALRWGPANSMNVVQYTGAQKGLLTRSGLRVLLRRAPARYRAKKL